MRKLITIIMLAFVCGSFAMAQTSTAAKKATLLPDGTVITDLSTGEVVRTTGGTTEYVAPTSPVQVSFNGASTGPATTSKAVGNGTSNIVLPTTGNLISTGSTAQPNNIPVKQPVNNATKLNPN